MVGDTGQGRSTGIIFWPDDVAEAPVTSIS